MVRCGVHAQAVFPEFISEGEGSAHEPDQEDMVRAVPVVLLGSNFSPDTVASVEGEGFAPQEVSLTVSGDGHWAAFPIRISVDPNADASYPESKNCLRIAYLKS